MSGSTVGPAAAARSLLLAFLLIAASVGLVHLWLPGPQPALEQRLTVAIGRTRLDVPVEAVTHITVDDHYCYMHEWRDGRAGKTALGMPLRDLHPQLPEHFLQVHRSHVVNLHAVTEVVREGRECRLAVPGAVALPVSRQRLGQVLARLEESGVSR